LTLAYLQTGQRAEASEGDRQKARGHVANARRLEETGYVRRPEVEALEAEVR
jgi:hypothetical protein